MMLMMMVLILILILVVVVVLPPQHNACSASRAHSQLPDAAVWQPAVEMYQVWRHLQHSVALGHGQQCYVSPSWCPWPSSTVPLLARSCSLPVQSVVPVDEQGFLPPTPHPHMATASDSARPCVASHLGNCLHPLHERAPLACNTGLPFICGGLYQTVDPDRMAELENPPSLKQGSFSVLRPSAMHRPLSSIDTLFIKAASFGDRALRPRCFVL